MKIRLQTRAKASRKTHGHNEEFALGREHGFWGSRQSRMQRRMMMGARGRGRGA